MSHTRMRRVSQTNESCHAHGQVMYRPLIIGTTRPKDASRGASATDTLSRMSHVSHTNVSCHAHERVMYRPLIIGTIRPKDATRGASAKDTLSPTPPVECCSRSVCVGECVGVCMCMCVCACVCMCMCTLFLMGTAALYRVCSTGLR